jgi:hypothetical protein
MTSLLHLTYSTHTIIGYRECVEYMWEEGGAPVNLSHFPARYEEIGVVYSW